jgi:hypothetical protein
MVTLSFLKIRKSVKIIFLSANHKLLLIRRISEKNQQMELTNELTLWR